MSFQGHYKGIRFRSLLELSCMKMFERQKIRFFYEPWPIEYRVGKRGKFRKYWFDFLLRDSNMIIEVKPKKRVNERRNLAKAKAAIPLLTSMGYTYHVWTEHDIDVLRLADVVNDPDIMWCDRTRRSRAFRKLSKGKNK